MADTPTPETSEADVETPEMVASSTSEEATREETPIDDGRGVGTADARLAPDTTLYTGVYDATNGKGYLAVLNYREPQGVGVWSARLQHARSVDHDGLATTAEVERGPLSIDARFTRI